MSKAISDVSPMPAPPAVSAQEICVSFRGPVLTDVSFESAAGDWLTIIGPNGAGKTTLLRTLAGLIGTDHGQALIAGQPVRQLSPRQRARQVAFIPQSPVAPAGMKALDYVLLGREPHRTASLAALAGFAGSQPDLAVVTEIMERLDILQFAAAPIDQLSGGERQRVTIARALAQQTDLLLLDEPTSALDLKQKLEVMELLDELRAEQSLTLITAMHDLSLAGQFATKLLLLADGKPQALGSPREILTHSNIQTYYGASVQVMSDRTGAVMLNLRRDRVAHAESAAGN